MSEYTRIGFGPGEAGTIASGTYHEQPAVFIVKDKAGDMATPDLILCFETKERARFVADVLAGSITEQPAIDPTGSIPLENILVAQVHIGTLEAIASSHYDGNRASVGERLDNVARWLRSKFPTQP